MRFMIIVKASAGSEAGEWPDARLATAMARYHEALAQAGVLLDANGLKPSREGWRLHYRGGERRVVEGPFADAPSLVAGYTLIQVRSAEEAMEWARRCPAPGGEGAEGEIELRPLLDLEPVGPALRPALRAFTPRHH